MGHRPRVGWITTASPIIDQSKTILEIIIGYSRWDHVGPNACILSEHLHVLWSGPSLARWPWELSDEIHSHYIVFFEASPSHCTCGACHCLFKEPELIMKSKYPWKCLAFKQIFCTNLSFHTRVSSFIIIQISLYISFHFTFKSYPSCRF